MNGRSLRRVLIGYLLLLAPLAWFAAKFDRYAIDGDAVGYMDIADLLRAHQWSAAVNAYWHPLYPAMLAMAQVIGHTSRVNELGAYYALNFCLFVAQVAAMLLFVRGIVRLRARLAPGVDALLSGDALALLGVSLLVIAMQRELTLGKVRTDGLLQALILLALAMLLEALAAETSAGSIAFASMMGLSLGLAYLTKSFAFPLALICVAVLVLFGAFAQKRSLTRCVVQGAAGFFVFGLIAGPYVAALSKQKGRFDFGDSGNLNYVWYVSGTEKMHLEPWMTDKFGSATVHLIHPEKQLLASPGIYSYKAMVHGTYPPWFDATYWNEHITPKFDAKLLAKRDARNVVLIFRYLLNHPEPLLLLAVLLAAGAGFRGDSRYAWPAAGVGVLMWAIYAMVNVEERYVTAAYLAVLLPVFAALKTRSGDRLSSDASRTAMVALLLFSVLILAETAREDAQNRREESGAGLTPAWRDPQIFGAAAGLAKMGIKPGDEIACVGEEACVYDFYWARLAGVRVMTEIFEPTRDHLMDRLDTLPNRDEAYGVVQHEGAKVLVAAFDPGEVNASHPAAAGWVRLGETNYYALPLQGQ